MTVLSSSNALSLEGCFLKSSPGPFIVNIRKGLGPPSYRRALNRKGHAFSVTNCTWLSSGNLAASFIPSLYRRQSCTKWFVFFLKPSLWHILPTGSAVWCDPRLLSKVSVHEEPSNVSLCEILFHSTKRHYALLPRPYEPYHSSIRGIVFSGLDNVSFKSFVQLCAWRACESLD